MSSFYLDLWKIFVLQNGKLKMNCYKQRTIIRTGRTCKKIPFQKSIENGMALK